MQVLLQRVLQGMAQAQGAVHLNGDAGAGRHGALRALWRQGVAEQRPCQAHIVLHPWGAEPAGRQRLVQEQEAADVHPEVRLDLHASPRKLQGRQQRLGETLVLLKADISISSIV